MTAKSIWKWENVKQKRKMEEEVTRDNCGEKLRLVRDISGISRRDIAKVLGVQESTIYRLERRITKPSDEFMNRLRALQVIGFAKFQKMTKDEKNKAAELVAAGTGIGAGIGASIAAISAAGTVSGLSAAGITSGLAAIGGTMLGGVVVVATIPLAAGVLGYGIVKGIRKICENNKLSCKKRDDRWEIRKENNMKSDRDKEN